MNFEAIPLDIQSIIFSNLSIEDVLNFSLTSSSKLKDLSQSFFWQSFAQRDFHINIKGDNAKSTYQNLCLEKNRFISYMVALTLINKKMPKTPINPQEPTTGFDFSFFLPVGFSYGNYNIEDKKILDNDEAMLIKSLESEKAFADHYQNVTSNMDKKELKELQVKWAHFYTDVLFQNAHEPLKEQSQYNFEQNIVLSLTVGVLIKLEAELTLKYLIDINQLNLKHFDFLTILDSRSIKMIKLLIEHGADLNQKYWVQECHFTPLAFVITAMLKKMTTHEFSDIITLLLEKGADPKAMIFMDDESSEDGEARVGQPEFDAKYIEISMPINKFCQKVLEHERLTEIDQNERVKIIKTLQMVIDYNPVNASSIGGLSC